MSFYGVLSFCDVMLRGNIFRNRNLITFNETIKCQPCQLSALTQVGARFTDEAEDLDFESLVSARSKVTISIQSLLSDNFH